MGGYILRQTLWLSDKLSEIIKARCVRLLATFANEILGCRVQILESLLNESEFELDHLRGEIEIARKAEADLRSALTEIDGRAHAATQNLEAEKARLQAALDRANGERVRLAYDIANMKRQVDSNAVEPQNFFQQLELNGHETLQGPSERKNHRISLRR